MRKWIVYLEEVYFNLVVSRPNTEHGESGHNGLQPSPSQHSYNLQKEARDRDRCQVATSNRVRVKNVLHGFNSGRSM